MNTEALFLFLILLLGLVLSTFLGGNYGREGFSGKFSGTFNLNDKEDNKNMKISSGASTASCVQYDNYNHFTGSSTQLSPGTTFYSNDGKTAKVISNSDGSQSLEITLPSSSKPVTFNPPRPTTNQISSGIEIKTNCTKNTSSYYGPDGATATIVKTDNGQTGIKVTTSSGTYYYNTSGSQMMTDTSTQYYGSTGQPNQPAMYSMAYQQPQPYLNKLNNPYYGSDSNNMKNDKKPSSVAGSQNMPIYSPQVQKDNISTTTTTGTLSSDYYSTLPAGIPRSQIPPGKEDLYILKSQIVPPVCPACPVSTTVYPRQEKCPPCPPCARCPEPSFECKKVPNYNAINNEFLPAPILNDFSQFGM
jgi:hypothetical protein